MRKRERKGTTAAFLSIPQRSAAAAHISAPIGGHGSDTELAACEAERTKVGDDEFTSRSSDFSETTQKPLETLKLLVLGIFLGHLEYPKNSRKIQGG